MELITPNIWDLNYEIFLSILTSLVCGMILGIEREINNKWAGLRTHMLVCLGSCIFTVLSIYGFPIFSNPADPLHSSRFGDPTRIAAQILTGIGFIGGGTVLRHGTSVFGLTTAATLWVAAAVGMACACKMYYMAILATVVVVAILVVIRFIEKRILHIHNPVNVKLDVCIEKAEAENLCKTLSKQFKIKSIEQKNSEDSSNCSSITATIQINKKEPIDFLYEQFAAFGSVSSLSIKELDKD